MFIEVAPQLKNQNSTAPCVKDVSEYVRHMCLAFTLSKLCYSNWDIDSDLCSETLLTLTNLLKIQSDFNNLTRWNTHIINHITNQKLKKIDTNTSLGWALIWFTQKIPQLWKNGSVNDFRFFVSWLGLVTHEDSSKNWLEYISVSLSSLQQTCGGWLSDKLGSVMICMRHIFYYFWPLFIHYLWFFWILSD